MMAPKDENELRHMLKTAIYSGVPMSLRYPRGAGYGVEMDAEVHELEIGRGELLLDGSDLCIIAVGSTVYPALEAAEALGRKVLVVQQLRGTGAQVLVLGPIPAQPSVVAICLSEHLDDATACSPPRSTAVNESGIAAESSATKAGGGHYADLTELFCTADRCPVIIGNSLVYLDSSHVSLEYSRLLAPVIGALADRALAGG